RRIARCHGTLATVARSASDWAHRARSGRARSENGHARRRPDPVGRLEQAYVSEEGTPRRSADLERDFRENRLASLIAVNLNNFWSTAILVLAFGLWDLFVDAAHWRSAFLVRSAGAAIVVATGLFQQLPGKGTWLPLMAKVRMA